MKKSNHGKKYFIKIGNFYISSIDYCSDCINTTFIGRINLANQKPYFYVAEENRKKWQEVFNKLNVSINFEPFVEDEDN